jgi:DNA mismatch endonuclease, patch repair protein
MDRVSKETRSRIMATVKGKGNKSTEQRLRAYMVRAGFRHWHMHDRSILGRPDFVFEAARVAVFVDGCFWHGCPKCCRRPKSSTEYWNAKIDRNMARDQSTLAELTRQGWTVVRVWEHEVKRDASSVIATIKAAVRGAENRGDGS